MPALTAPLRATRPVAAPRRPARGERRDPAPSRLSYRRHRIWLTPLYRRLLRVGLPAFLAALAFGLWFGEAERRAQSAAWVEGVRAGLADRPELRVQGLSVHGASAETEAALRAALGLRFPVSSLALDLEALRGRLTALDPVARAELRVNAAGALEVRIAERLPVLVWRRGGALELLDETGHRVAALPLRHQRSDLPLIAGEGADRNIPEALALLAAAEPLRDRMRGLVRMGDRRWDLVLDRQQRILLPEAGAVAALERVIALDEAEDLLDRDVLSVDLRNGHRPTLRLAPPALAVRLGLDATATLASAPGGPARPAADDRARRSVAGRGAPAAGPAARTAVKTTAAGTAAPRTKSPAATSAAAKTAAKTPAATSAAKEPSPR